VAKLCEATVNRRGLHAVVTINYDSLLRAGAQRGTDTGQMQTHLEIGGEALAEEKGHFPRAWYLPANGSGSPYGEIMLTEAQYHGAASDPYSWSNLTLIQCFSASTGLMVGMSMTDRNLRRLLHALHSTQLSEKQYVILKEPEAPIMNNCDIREAKARAVTYAQRFAGSGLKKGNKPGKAMQAILEELVRQEKTMAQKALVSMGVTPVWVRQHTEIPVIVEAVATS